jgi:dTDP-4-dehydrorhamnose 3,5-epimerase
MIFTPTEIAEVIQVEPRLFGDSRGFNMETYHARKFVEGGISATFVQDNHSRSCRNVLRGLHYQLRKPQGKLVRVVVGEVFDVAVDIRRSSPSFGQWVGRTLSGDNHLMLWLPPGFAHGFYVLSDWAEVAYKLTELYLPEADRSLLWCDPELKIDWHIPASEVPSISVKDAQGLPLSRAEIFD